MNILVVDDEPAVRRLEARWLTDAGHTCHEAQSAAEALDILEAVQINLVVLDIGLPDGSGLVLAHTVSRGYPALPIVMATGVADFASAAEAMRAGAVDYLVKPLERDVFLAAITRGLKRRAAVANPVSSPSLAPPGPAALPTPDPSVRTEVPIDRLFRAMCASGASDLHISATLPPMIRKDGHMMALEPEAAPLTAADVAGLLGAITLWRPRSPARRRGWACPRRH